MKIIGCAKDYYDFAGWGDDPSVVFKRDEVPYFNHESSLGLPHRITLFRHEDHERQVIPAYAIIGGIGKPMVRVRDDFHYDDSRHANAFSVEAAYALALEHCELFGDVPEAKARKAIDRMGLDRFFAAGDKDLTLICAANRFPAGVAEVANDEYRQELGTTFSPELLRDLGVDQIIPAHEAWVMISGFVASGMSQTAQAEVPNDVRIRKAGFDARSSFRKRPENEDAGPAL